MKVILKGTRFIIAAIWLAAIFYLALAVGILFREVIILWR